MSGLGNQYIVIIILAIIIILGGIMFVLFPESEEMPTNSEDFEQVQNGNTPTSADNAPPGSIQNLPVPDAVSAVRTHVAGDLGISEGVVIVMSAYEKEWPDACLGLAGEDELCAQVITSGFEVTVQAEGKQFVYRTNEDGHIIRQEL